MDSFLQKFSLQNLLRQFFCGVVFFVPLWLFTQDPGCKCCSSVLSDVTKWDTGTFLLFAALASVIGTIIYHLEKNLYSYAVQTIFELLDPWKEKYLCYVPCVIALVFSIAITPFFFETNALWVIVAFLVFLLIFVLLTWLFSSAFRRVIARTRECWYCEEKALNESTVINPRIYAIAKRVSSWSDFIHCSQSCCFAWISGYSICRIAWDFSWCGFCLPPCPYHEYLREQLMDASVGIALCILVMELIFDWHRYQHVIEMTRMTGIYDNNPLFKQEK